MDMSDKDEVRRELEQLFKASLAEEGTILSRPERQQMFEQIVAEIMGYGPLEPLLKDPSVTAVMVSGPKYVYAEREGRIEHVDASFEDDDHVIRMVERVIAPLGYRFDEGSPMVDVELPDGLNLDAIMPPISLVGPVVTIRKTLPFTMQQLVELGTITSEAVDFLSACVEKRQRILVCGTAGAGKTTFLRLLAALIPDAERVVVIEDQENSLPLSNTHLQRFPVNLSDHLHESHSLTLYEQVCIAAGIHQARLILADFKGQQFKNPKLLETLARTAYLTELPGRSPRSALLYLASSCLPQGVSWPLQRAFRALSDSLDLIVCLARFPDGTRKVVSIAAVPQSDGVSLKTQPLFTFQQTGIEEERILGQLQPVGYEPTEFLARLKAIQAPFRWTRA